MLHVQSTLVSKFLTHTPSDEYSVKCIVASLIKLLILFSIPRYIDLNFQTLIFNLWGKQCICSNIITLYFHCACSLWNKLASHSDRNLRTKNSYTALSSRLQGILLQCVFNSLRRNKFLWNTQSTLKYL